MTLRAGGRIGKGRTAESAAALRLSNPAAGSNGPSDLGPRFLLFGTCYGPLPQGTGARPLSSSGVGPWEKAPRQHSEPESAQAGVGPSRRSLRRKLLAAWRAEEAGLPLALFPLSFYLPSSTKAVPSQAERRQRAELLDSEFRED